MNSKEEALLGIIRSGGRLKTVDIVKNADMCKVTALKYLNSLKTSGFVDYELIGPTKLWYEVNKDGGGIPKDEASHKADTEFSELLKKFEFMSGKKAVVIMPIEDFIASSKRCVEKCVLAHNSLRRHQI